MSGQWTPKSGEENPGVQDSAAGMHIVTIEDQGDRNSRGRFVEESACTCKPFRVRGIGL